MPRPCDLLHPDPRPDTCILCRLDRDSPAHRALWDSGAARVWGVPESPSARGPGTELKKLLEELGVTAKDGCGCAAYVVEMNGWGPAGCRERRAEIVARLREQWGRLGWWDRVKSGVRALAETRSADPVGALVDEAICRAEATQTPSSDGS